MTANDERTPGQRLIGDFSPKLASLTDDVVFGDIWAREFPRLLAIEVPEPSSTAEPVATVPLAIHRVRPCLEA